MSCALRWLARCLPFRPCARWRWWRRAVGGRWSRRLSTGLWYRVPCCPGAVDTWFVALRIVAAEDYETHRARCTCEVWQ